MLKVMCVMIAITTMVSACQVDKNKGKITTNINNGLTAVSNDINSNNIDKIKVADAGDSSSVVKVLTDDIFFNEMVDMENSKATKTLTLKDNNLPIVIDFYADWCGPCVESKPYYENFAKQYQSRIVFYRIDIDKYKEAFAIFNRLVNENGGIPFFIFINTKDEIDYLTGWNSNVSPSLFDEKFAQLLQ